MIPTPKRPPRSLLGMLRLSIQNNNIIEMRFVDVDGPYDVQSIKLHPSQSIDVNIMQQHLLHMGIIDTWYSATVVYSDNHLVTMASDMDEMLKNMGVVYGVTPITCTSSELGNLMRHLKTGNYVFMILSEGTVDYDALVRSKTIETSIITHCTRWKSSFPEDRQISLEYMQNLIVTMGTEVARLRAGNPLYTEDKAIEKVVNDNINHINGFALASLFRVNDKVNLHFNNDVVGRGLPVSMLGTVTSVDTDSIVLTSPSYSLGERSIRCRFIKSVSLWDKFPDYVYDSRN